jgi:Flp pilus assembly protein TadG
MERVAMKERGQATLELLITLLLLLPILFGGLSLAQGYSACHALENGTAVAARQIALNPNAWMTALMDVQTAVDGSLLGGTGSNVTCNIHAEDGNAADPSTLAFGERFSVTCSVPFEAQIPFVSTAPRTLQTIHYEVMERYP